MYEEVISKIESIIDFLHERDEYTDKFNVNDEMIKHIAILSCTKSQSKMTEYIYKILPIYDSTYSYVKYMNIDRKLKNNIKAYINILIGNHLNLTTKQISKLFTLYEVLLGMNSSIHYRYYTLLFIVICIAHDKNIDIYINQKLQKFLESLLKIEFPVEISFLIPNFAQDQNIKLYHKFSYCILFKNLEEKKLNPDINIFVDINNLLI